MAANIYAGTLKTAIAYYNLLSFCPPARLDKFQKASARLRRYLAKEAGMPQKKFFPKVVPQVGWRMVAFNQNSREPDKKIVKGLVRAAKDATKNQKSLAAFQAEMRKVAALPGRAAVSA